MALPKELVAERAKYCCEYCLSQVKYSADPFSIDHIFPQTAGGSDDLDNLAYACLGCNGCKFTATTALDPLTGEEVALYHPRQDQWSQHFTWNAEFTFIIGLTPTGRATVQRLQLNREGVVNLRRVLSAANKQPPY